MTVPETHTRTYQLEVLTFAVAAAEPGPRARARPEAGEAAGVLGLAPNGTLLAGCCWAEIENLCRCCCPTLGKWVLSQLEAEETASLKVEVMVF